MSRKHFLIPSLIVLLVAVAGLYLAFLRQAASTDQLEGSGQVRGTEITLSSRLPGRVLSVPVREGDFVKKGDLIAELSSEEIEARVEQARSEVEAARNQVEEWEAALKQSDTAIEQARTQVEFLRESSYHAVHQAKATLQQTEATTDEAQSRLDLAREDHQRYAILLQRGAVSAREADQMKTRLDSARANLNGANQAREAALAALQKAEASGLEVQAQKRELQRVVYERQRIKALHATAQNQLGSAVARLKEVEATFKNTRIHAPSEGTVVNKLVEEGELVTVGTPIVTLINLSDLYIRVYIPEKDFGKLRLGNPAEIIADAFPDRPFVGKVTEIAQEAEFTPREIHVQEERTKLVFGVKVRIENPRGFLKPGMPVDVKIHWRGDEQF